MKLDSHLLKNFQKRLQRKQFTEALRIIDMNGLHTAAEMYVRIEDLVEKSFEELLLDESEPLSHPGVITPTLTAYDRYKYPVAKKLFASHWPAYVTKEILNNHPSLALNISTLPTVQLTPYIFEQGLICRFEDKRYHSFEAFADKQLPQAIPQQLGEHLHAAVQEENYELAALLRDLKEEYKVLRK